MALSIRNDTSIRSRRVNVQLFENPHGHQFEVITFRKSDVTLHWPADKLLLVPGLLMDAGYLSTVWNSFRLGLPAQEDFASSLLMIPKSFKS
ncbi:hypothetical protein KUCAC02_029357 [Chaenocephalus aceratus]|uniref:Uncharacterized protein n=1 Tax=Chaenocephalus aceratus TaxID=36190 RepID=A0ACB9X5Q8_CHAAC|nr:hypothetical protein KUCAC02_029357 [Chaenocephalus aceratus]